MGEKLRKELEGHPLTMGSQDLGVMMSLGAQSEFILRTQAAKMHCAPC